MRKTIALLVTAALVASSSVAFAQEHVENGQCHNQSNTGGNDASQTFCFQPENVAGSLVGAEGQSTRPIRPMHGPSLIRWRAHFVPEMLKSVETI